MTWENQFRSRMKRFNTSIPAQGESVPISIKVRVTSGCFHREHSPNAYQIIDDFLNSYHHSDFEFQEHESGPELLVYLSLVSAGVSLTANIINLVTAIIKARTEGIKHGDRPDTPLELIVRGFDEDGKLKEEKVLKIASSDIIDKKVIEQALLDSTNKMFPKNKGKKKGRTKR
jgi:hypothetical protein